MADQMSIHWKVYKIGGDMVVCHLRKHAGPSPEEPCDEDLGIWNGSVSV